MKLDNQPSTKGPSIRRKIQLREKFPLQRPITTANSSHESRSDKLRDSRVEPESESCPPGSVPVLKATKGGPLNFTAIDEFASSRARSFLKSKSTEPLVEDPSNHEYAKCLVEGSYGGGEGTLSIWRPTLEDTTEMSLSQIWVAHEKDDETIMSLEAGWMIQPNIYGDTKARFFIFTTNDEYKSWLYNDNRRVPTNNPLEFIRVNKYMPFGKKLQLSTVDGPRSEIQITIKRNEYYDWELWVDGIMIGYWLKSNYRVRTANQVLWGGEIVNLRTRGRHTSTQMGSGHFSTEPIGRVAYISKMGLYNRNQERYDAPQEIDLIMTHPTCYDITYWNANEDFGHFITFGGPGYDQEKCP